MTDNNIKLWIDEKEVKIEKGSTILDAAKKAGKHIPTLCHLKEINEIGACRVCLVEDVDSGKLMTSCVTPAIDGMRILTNTERVRYTRKLNVEFLLSNHTVDCPTCLKNDNCELRILSEELGLREMRFEGIKTHYPKDESTPSLFRDPDKCILCRRCESVCEKVQSVNALVTENRGFDTVVGPAFYGDLAESPCVLCGQCSLVCPTGAITEVEYIDEVWKALSNDEKHVLVQTAPAVRVALAEAFDADAGKIVTGQMVSALKKMGFDKVFDTQFTADLTIMEEGTELINRITKGETLPLFTSCSPGWINFIEQFYPEFLDHVSSCKSPQQMFGALAKSYYAEKNNIPRENVVSVSIMPCTAKKYEAQRVEMKDDVDYVLTTRELGRMIKQAGLDIMKLEEEEYDHLMGASTGAATIFGATGGVMEAAIRTAYVLITGEELKEIDITAVRGFEGIKEAEVKINDDITLKAAVTHGLGNARKILEKIKAGAEYHFVEFMACPGGCIGGGGQPLPATDDVLKKRLEAIYENDKRSALRKSHENPYIKKIYDEYLGEPNSHLSHELLHTKYTPRRV